MQKMKEYAKKSQKTRKEGKDCRGDLVATVLRALQLGLHCFLQCSAIETRYPDRVMVGAPCATGVRWVITEKSNLIAMIHKVSRFH